MSTVEFPGLWELKFTVNRVAFEVFGMEIYWYGIIIAAAFLTAVLLGMRDSKKYGLEPDNVIDLILIAAPVAIICARLYYVIFSWSDFKGNIVEVFNIRSGGLAIYGGIIGGIAAAYFYAKRKKIGVLRLFDFGAPYLPLAQAIGRWGNFINQEAYGANTTLPWGMTSDTIKQDIFNNIDVLKSRGIIVDPNLPVHPTFLYESLWNFALFFLLIWYRKRKKLEGEVFFLYMALYGVGRFLIEGLRTDSLMLGSFRISQILAAMLAVFFGIVFYVRRKRASRKASEDVEAGTSDYGTVLEQLKKDDDKLT
jgi:phosphatidylglycerol:prolipoprotein diacylglycerol transferase